MMFEICYRIKGATGLAKFAVVDAPNELTARALVRQAEMHQQLEYINCIHVTNIVYKLK